MPLGTPTGPAGEKALPSHAEQHRPRASARMNMGRCGTSATTGAVGLRRCPAPVSAAWTSAPPGSGRRIAAAVRTVFSCVASRNRESLVRVFCWV